MDGCATLLTQRDQSCHVVLRNHGAASVVVRIFEAENSDGTILGVGLFERVFNIGACHNSIGSWDCIESGVREVREAS
jgi:hypothetical protein